MSDIEIPEHDDVQLEEKESECENCDVTTKTVMKGAPGMLFFPVNDARFKVDIEICQNCGAISPVEFDETEIDKYSDVYMSVLDEHDLISEEELEEIYGE